MKKGAKKKIDKSHKIHKSYGSKKHYRTLIIMLVLALILLFILLFISYKPEKITKGLSSLNIRNIGISSVNWNDCSFNGIINPASIIPYPQNITTLSCNIINVNSSWKIYANLSDIYDNFTAYYLQNFTLNKTGILLLVDDLSNVSSNDRIIIGNPVIDPRVKSISDSYGIDFNSEITKGFGHGYILLTDSNQILILGNTTAGTFYGAISLLWLINSSGTNIILPNVKIDDWPDLKVRGFYGAGDYYSSEEQWIDNLSMMKFNLWISGLSTSSCGDSVNSLLERENFLKQRHFFTSLPLMPACAVDFNPNLYEGIFIQNVSMRFNSSDQAELVNDSEIVINNPGFETEGTDGLPEFWTQVLNTSTNYWSLDFSDKHSGNCSAKLTDTQTGDFEGANLITSSPMYYPILQNQVYEISVWGKRNGSDLNDPRTQVTFVLVNSSNNSIGSSGVIFDGNNNTWREYITSLPTFEPGVSGFYVYSRAQGPVNCSFQLWIDDLNITLISNKLLNVVNTSDSQLQVWNENKTIKYVLGIDYNLTVIGSININDPLKGSKTIINRIPTGNIPVNSNILVDYDFIPDSSLTNYFSFSDPETLNVYNESVLNPVLSAITPDFVYVGLDEINGFNRDSRALKNGFENYQTLAYFINNMTKLIHSYNSSIQVLMWDDMVNPLHNGGSENYQTYFAGQPGKSWYALDMMDRSVRLISWDYDNDSGPIVIGDYNGKKRISPNLYNTYGFQSFAGPSVYSTAGDSMQWSYEAYKYNMEGMIGSSYYNNISTIYYPANYSWNAVKDKSLSELSLCEDGSSDFNLTTDPFDCGSCGNICYLPNSYQSCINGECHFDGCMEEYVLNNGNCVLNNSCGDGICDNSIGETCSTCPADCGNCTNPNQEDDTDNGNFNAVINYSNHLENNTNVTLPVNKPVSNQSQNKTAAIEIPKENYDYLVYTMMILCVIFIIIIIALLLIRYFKNRVNKKEPKNVNENNWEYLKNSGL